MRKILLSNLFLLLMGVIYSQKPVVLNTTNKNIFNTDVFIENKGQYNQMTPYGDQVLYGIDHFSAKIFFSKNAIIYKYDFFKNDGHEAHEELEHAQGKELEELRKKYADNISTKYLVAEWLNTNKDVTIETSEKTNNYYSYGNAQQQAYGYKTITYKNIYDGIDIVYTIDGDKGIKYTIYAQPHADLSKVQFSYGGDLKSIDLIKSNIEVGIGNVKLKEEAPHSFYEDRTSIESNFKLEENTVHFEFPKGYDASKPIIIDPWIVPITTLAGAVIAVNKGFDVDFDFDGNLYVYGGGGAGSTTASNQKTAKYTVAGSLMWTFMGGLTTPFVWDIHAGWGYAGNFVVDKSNGKCYFSQGFNPTACEVIRINDLGFYDGWRNVPVSALNEGWELFYDCRTNAVLITGGSTASNRIISTLDPVTGVMGLSSFTGITGGFQDIVNSVSDRSGNIFVILASSSVASVNNRMYRLNAGYASFMWSNLSGYTTFAEADNKRYYSAGSNSNGFNALAVNDTFLYYYDGTNIKAFNKSTGLGVGTAVSVAGHVAKTQGGITVDDCNHVYVGGNNGNIKVYTFTGSSFVASSDIVIPGYAGRGIYDIRYNQNNNFLYVSGNGFVAIIDPPFICTSTTLADSIERYCTKSASVRILVPDSAATYSYIWQDTLTNVVVRSTYDTPNLSDTLRGMIPGRTYLLTVVKNLVCGGIRTTHFVTISPDSVIANVTICPGEIYRVGTHSYTTAGTYRDTIVTAYGCDSVVITNLTLGPNFIRTQNINVCPGVFVNVGTHSYSVAGTYRDTFARGGGLCDSIVITNLTIRPTSAFSRTVRICPGGYLVVGSRVYTTAGTYRDTMRNFVGCDSVLTSILVADTIPIFRQSYNLCNGRSLVVGSTVYTTAGTFTTTLSRGGACDSTVITTITLISSSSRTLTYSICLGDTVRVGADVYTLAGTYRDTLPAYNGCDSFLTINISYSSTIPTRTQVVRICAGRSYVFNGHTYTTAATYRDTVSVPGPGCDSVITTILLVDPNYTITRNIRICQGNAYVVGTHTYTTTGTYRDTFTFATTCDSIFVTNLTVDTLARFNQTINICQGESYTINAHTYSISGIYLDTLRRTGICDSIITTTLNVRPVSARTIDTSFCTGGILRIGTSSYTTSGTRYDTLVNYLGCDSTVRSNLTVYAISTSSRNISRCYDDSFFVQGAWRRTSGTYYDTLNNVRGCDSILTTILNIIPLQLGVRNISICRGTSYFCAGANQNTTGSYYDTLISSLSCDSILRTNLTINPILQGVRNITICLGTSYFCGGANQNISGSYYDSLTNAAGCDSVLRTNLTVNPILQGVRNINICLGTSYFCGGANQNTSGTYYDSLTNASGCDSVLRTNLTINPILQGFRTISICNGDTYFCGGANQSTSGFYYDSITNVAGCDSVLRTNLIVNNANTATRTVNKCVGQSFVCGGATQTSNGTYFDTLNNIYGCDSILSTILIFNPLPSIDAGNDTSICKNQSARLQATGIGSMVWSNGVLTATNIVTPLANTLYYVTITDANSCTNKDSVNVTVKPLPLISVADTIICRGESAVLFASGGVSYQWNLNDGTFTTSNPVTVNTTNTTAYTVVVTGINGCIDSLDEIVSISPVFVDILATPDSIIRRGTVVSLFANLLHTSDSIIAWKPASLLTSTTSNPTTTSPTTSQWYYVTTINADGCITKDSIYIEVIPVDDIIAPTAFSPNGDGKNDVFRLVLTPYLELESFIIVNRWGEEVFNYPKGQAGDGWNGIYKEREQPTSTFVWYAVAKSKLTMQKTYKTGNVTLIR